MATRYATVLRVKGKFGSEFPLDTESDFPKLIPDHRFNGFKNYEDIVDTLKTYTGLVRFTGPDLVAEKPNDLKEGDVELQARSAIHRWNLKVQKVDLDASDFDIVKYIEDWMYMWDKVDFCRRFFSSSEVFGVSKDIIVNNWSLAYRLKGLVYWAKKRPREDHETAKKHPREDHENAFKTDLAWAASKWDSKKRRYVT